MIVFDDASRWFRQGRARGRVHALRSVSVEVPEGACWAVVGPNGAGKTTLFALLLGFLRPSGGAVRIDGRDPRRWVAEEGAAFLPERFSLPGDWPVRESLVALGRLEGLGRGASSRTDELMEELGLTDHAGRRTAELSRGLLQRLGLAQSLLAERRLVVLDEPAEGLDPVWRIRLRSILERLRDEGRTVLIASHDLAEVERVADRALVLEDGRVRELLEIEPAQDRTLHYRIGLDVAADGAADVARAFPDARREESGRETDYLVTAASASELSARLAALLAAGGVVREVTPLRQPLEERVRGTLEEGP